jgi:hypothetical protein
MIRGSIERLAILCAAAGVTASEWDDFVTEVRQAGSEETRRLYTRLRHQLRSLEKALNEEDLPSNGPLELTLASVVRDVNRLIDEADISTPTAAHLLIKQLRSQEIGFDEETFRFNAKEGLRRWLYKIMREYGENSVLSAASAAFRGPLPEATWRLSR